MSPKVILVNRQDEAIGEMEKMEAHQQGALHRAFSVFLFNAQGELLLQKRADDKYHAASLWSNTCCSHPMPGEEIRVAAQRRLQEEMGIQTTLIHAGTAYYCIDMKNDLTEHELDHLLIGRYDAAPIPNEGEVAAWQYVSIADLQSEILAHPNQFTPWFLLLESRLPSFWEQLQVGGRL